jgi:hypothetical protein
VLVGLRAGLCPVSCVLCGWVLGWVLGRAGPCAELGARLCARLVCGCCAGPMWGWQGQLDRCLPPRPKLQFDLRLCDCVTRCKVLGKERE